MTFVMLGGATIMTVMGKEISIFIISTQYTSLLNQKPRKRSMNDDFA